MKPSARTWAAYRNRATVVVLRYSIDRKQTFIKRVAGIPGDRLRIENKQLYRNGKLVAEPYVQHKTGYIDPYRDNFPSDPNVRLYPPAETMLKNNVRAGEVVVPEGKYFVMGDNRDSSLDSRYWGFVSSDEIVGRPVLIYESFNLGEPKAAPSILKTRWNRVLKPI